MYEQRTTIIEMWAFPDDTWSTVDLTGFDVEARDGHIGTVDEATTGAANFLVVKTGTWIFGKRVMLPAGVISGVDAEQRNIMVDLTKDQIANAPEFEEDAFRGAEYRERLGSYYAARPAGPDYGKDDRPIR